MQGRDALQESFVLEERLLGDTLPFRRCRQSRAGLACTSIPISGARSGFAARAAAWDKKGRSMKTRTVSLGIGETPGATRLTRKDFLKIGAPA